VEGVHWDGSRDGTELPSASGGVVEDGIPTGLGEGDDARRIVPWLTTCLIDLESNLATG
jgi:hypothetical protein